MNDVTIKESEYLLIKELLVELMLKSGIQYNSNEYKNVVSFVGQKYIILAKIKRGYALTDEEKGYLINNLN